MLPLIREAVGGDEAALRRLAWLLWDHHHAACPERFRTADEITGATERSPPPFQVAERVHVAEVSGEVAGYARAVLREAPQSLAYRPQRVVILTEIAVLPGYRGLGLGRALMTAVRDWAYASCAEAIEVPVFGFNRHALALYEGMGFAPWLLQLRCPLTV
ncbi:GNAT family N-acetyltransferase [Methylobacterium nonmethylotrophicum]|uniref:GNAT family N-acetyltransferase n=1 Tax=Methylobacterium nonmethylotrophicum TaxID=1141884 RepID=A0A4Z0NEC4_9HYPH|nr:GNAT family N-acetyltransferase [Methylobacterium nonmethylotrophicum]TGD92491.1 GNAT family N-acetyltransferase [Methylobacterium nonmethylotrophicum]